MDKCREAFEVWYKEEFGHSAGSFHDGNYVGIQSHGDWKAWNQRAASAEAVYQVRSQYEPRKWEDKTKHAWELSIDCEKRILFKAPPANVVTGINSGSNFSNNSIDIIGAALYIYWDDVNDQAKNAYRKKIRAALTAALTEIKHGKD